MSNYILVFGFVLFGFLFLAAAIYISKYRQRGCCADLWSGIQKDSDSCRICPNYTEPSEPVTSTSEDP